MRLFTVKVCNKNIIFTYSVQLTVKLFLLYINYIGSILHPVEWYFSRANPLILLTQACSFLSKRTDVQTSFNPGKRLDHRTNMTFGFWYILSGSSTFLQHRLNNFTYYIIVYNLWLISSIIRYSKYSFRIPKRTK